MTDLVNAPSVPPSVASQGRRRDSHDTITADRPKRAEWMTAEAVPMDMFKWIVSGLLGALVVGVGWFLTGIQADLRDVRKEMTGLRVESAVTNTKLEELIAEFRRRPPR